jgi:phosphatidylinositol kinase/protein kinase (PI-3  family)
MDREKFPEKIPFRLTRMLINAMEVSGIEGNFRTTCSRVMRVLRENKESVMAVLEVRKKKPDFFCQIFVRFFVRILADFCQIFCHF